MFSTVQSLFDQARVRRVLLVIMLLAAAFALGFAARQLAVARSATPNSGLQSSAVLYPILGLPLVHAVLAR